VLGAGSVLFSLADLTAEMAGEFALEMAWRRHAPGEMYGATYTRRLLATIWRPALA
jgi:hypothetical protein